MKLDHITIVTEDLEAARNFLCSIIGLKEGPRPPFGVRGHWLYADGRPVIHLVEAPATMTLRLNVPHIEHVGLRIDTVHSWSALLERVRRSGIPCQVSEVPLTGERQLFVTMAPGIVMELITDHSPSGEPAVAR